MKQETSVIQKKFGKRVKEIRLKKKLSQEKLAFRCKLDRTYISGIERGLRNPALKNIDKLAKNLKISIDTLFKFHN